MESILMESPPCGLVVAYRTLSSFLSSRSIPTHHCLDYGWHFEPRKKMGGISGGCELGDVNCGKVWGRARLFLTDELLRCYHKAAGNVEVLK